MLIVFYLQNPRIDGQLFLAPLGGRRPLKMKYTYGSSLCHVVSEYIWLWGSISITHGLMVSYFLHLQEGDAFWK